MLKPLLFSTPAWGVLLAFIGAVLFVQGRAQMRLLKRRISKGAGTIIIDPVTGLFSAAAAWQSIRAEANRAHRLQRPLQIWVGTAKTEALSSDATTKLVEVLPREVTGIRLSRKHVCFLSCTLAPDAFEASASTIFGAADDYAHSVIEPSDATAEHTLGFISEQVAA